MFHAMQTFVTIIQLMYSIKTIVHVGNYQGPLGNLNSMMQFTTKKNP